MHISVIVDMFGSYIKMHILTFCPNHEMLSYYYAPCKFILGTISYYESNSSLALTDNFISWLRFTESTCKCGLSSYVVLGIVSILMTLVRYYILSHSHYITYAIDANQNYYGLRACITSLNINLLCGSFKATMTPSHRH